jgi:OFA family oxalate/formate antiporter-like MFS transporter
VAASPEGASGIAVSAFAFSTVIFTPVSKWLMTLHTVGSVVNFKPVFLTLSVVFFLAGMLGTLFVRLPGEAYLKSLPAEPVCTKVFTGKNLTLGQAMKTLPFWCIFLEILFINGTWTLAVPLIVDQGIKHGLTEAAAVATLTVTGIFNAGGRLVMAVVSDKLGRTFTIIILAVLTLFGSVLMILGVPGFGYTAAVCIIAFGYGGPASINAAFTTDFFGPENSGTNYGAAMLALGFSSVLFNSVSAHFLKGNFTKTFIMAAATAVIPILLMLLVSRAEQIEGAKKFKPKIIRNTP